VDGFQAPCRQRGLDRDDRVAENSSSHRLRPCDPAAPPVRPSQRHHRRGMMRPRRAVRRTHRRSPAPERCLLLAARDHFPVRLCPIVLPPDRSSCRMDPGHPKIRFVGRGAPKPWSGGCSESGRKSPSAYVAAVAPDSSAAGRGANRRTVRERGRSKVSSNSAGHSRVSGSAPVMGDVGGLSHHGASPSGIDGLRQKKAPSGRAATS